METKTIKLEFTIPKRYAGSDDQMFAAMVAGSIADSKHLKKDVIKCIVKNGVKVIGERDEMLGNLSHYICNEGHELPRILDELLSLT